MMLRIQLERQGKLSFPSLREYYNTFGLTPERLHRAREGVVVMHPGPMNRGVEIAAEVAEGPASVITEQVANGVAVRMAHKVLGDLSGRAVLLIGAGEMAQLAARELHAGGASELLVANRSGSAAEALAKEVGGIPVGLGDLPALLERVDVVLCSTGAKQPIVTRELIARVLKGRRYRPLFLIDLGVPRNFDERLNALLQKKRGLSRDLLWPFRSEAGDAEALLGAITADRYAP